ncbi:hypothetical protein HYD88_02955 [Mycoplasmopsis bovis]|nr:hypothetical protein [Mycoplasmopsis bovis]QQH36451.1 hypothetical protein HYD88_02955 [Mycoplasmopsis bovis]
MKFHIIEFDIKFNKVVKLLKLGKNSLQMIMSLYGMWRYREFQISDMI